MGYAYAFLWLLRGGDRRVNPSAIDRELGLTVEHARRAQKELPESFGQWRVARSQQDPDRYRAISKLLLRQLEVEAENKPAAAELVWKVVDSREFGEVAIGTAPLEGIPTLLVSECEALAKIEDRGAYLEALRVLIRTKRATPNARLVGVQR